VTMRIECTCAGTEPGYPQHEGHCAVYTGINPDYLAEPDGCCGACFGQGVIAWEGACSDCQGTGHAHEDPESCGE
jgi:DnaJ-class molecular chaperone